VKLFGLIVALLLAFARVDGEGRRPVVIDTDGAADDLRAICLLLSSPLVEVRAIVSSEGALTPREAARKVRALLRALGREEIPVGEGRATGLAPPPWRAHSRRVPWGEEEEDAPLDAVELLYRYAGDATIVALGALTNPRDLLERRPSTRPRDMVWYNGRGDLRDGANYAADPDAAARVLSSGIPVEIVSGERGAFAVDEALLRLLAASRLGAARLVVSSHRSPALRALVSAGHLRSWDDLAALRLIAPDLFVVRALSPSVALVALEEGEAARVEFLRVLGAGD
jgi:pyrimidine-specific ribonucleoside hydrolase